MNNNKILVITHWDEKSEISSFLDTLNSVIERGYRSIQLRLEGITKERYAKIALLTSEAIACACCSFSCRYFDRYPLSAR